MTHYPFFAYFLSTLFLSSATVVVTGGSVRRANDNNDAKRTTTANTDNNNPFLWTLQAVQLNANDDDGAAGDYFGFDVAVDGSVMVVGAPLYDDEKGAVYVYHDRVLTAKLMLPDAMPKTCFGEALAVSNDTIVVGVPSLNKVYVYAWNGAEYQEQSVQLTPTTSQESNGFGWAVAVDRNFMVVSAPSAGQNSIGGVYVFERDATVWTQTAYLQPTEESDIMVQKFGWSVDLDGNRIVVAAPGANEQNGAASVYELRSDDGSSSSSWRLLAKLILPGTAGSLAYSTAISGDRVAIGIPSTLNGTGPVYVYSLFDLDHPTILQYSDNKGTNKSEFGGDLDLFGDVLVVGAPSAGDHILVYELNDGKTWHLVEELSSYDSFSSVATDGRTVVTGIPFFYMNRGAAFVYGKWEDDELSGSPASSASAPFGTRLNITILSMILAHFAVVWTF